MRRDEELQRFEDEQEKQSQSKSLIDNNIPG